MDSWRYLVLGAEVQSPISILYSLLLIVSVRDPLPWPHDLPRLLLPIILVPQRSVQDNESRQTQHAYRDQDFVPGVE